MFLNQIIEKIKSLSYFQQKIVEFSRIKKASFSGLVGSSSAFVVAALLASFRNLLIIASSTEKAQKWQKEISFLTQKEVVLFPIREIFPQEEIQPDKETMGQRLAILNYWQEAKKEILAVAPLKAVAALTSSPRVLQNSKLEISVASKIDFSFLINKLIVLGYRRLEIVGERGEFSVRGGIIDIFPVNFEFGVRLEFSGEEIISLRSFDPYSQKSIDKISSVVILPTQEKSEVPIFNYLPEDTVIILDEALDLNRVAQAEEIDFTDLKKEIAHYKIVEFSSFLSPEEETIFNPVPIYCGKIPEISPTATVISKHAARLREELPQNQIFFGTLSGGFGIESLNLTVLTDKEIFGEEFHFSPRKILSSEGVADELLVDLKLGDYVVHEDYGLGIFGGLKILDLEGVKQEYLLIEYAEGDKLYVPPSLIGRVEKYSRAREMKPKLSRLGGKRWGQTKNRVKESLQDLTQELLALYASREKMGGFSYPPDDLYQKELEGTFPYEETPDQKKAILETKSDLESPQPMDRLICGDVGYGKTEVAIRATAKVISAGKQAAILVPTTILAEQHYNNFKTRFQSFPFVVEMLSRFKSKMEQKQIIQALASGGIDLIIGTHRLFQKDIKFKDLGLLIVDEEQRFGVVHKEKLKKLKINVDVLTLTATPIPRTLYFSLSGVRDMSSINTPPLDRSAVRTYVLPWNEGVIREAILKELDRGGQIYFVHNFVETILGRAVKIRKLVPEAKIAIAHGKMPEKELEKTMFDFLQRKFDVLICTSIIESGLDIPNVNTLIVDQADRFGLSSLYQIRGRVGRSAVRAYAYLFYHPGRRVTDSAVERLKAIQEFTALGSGYKLAMRDLEIRGAGNLLGREQSGHIYEVGFDLYCELLEEAVREIKGIKEPLLRQVTIDLKIEAYIPPSYISDERQRMAIYRRMNHLATKEEVEDLKKELLDRFGKIPIPLEKLFAILYLKTKALSAGIKSIKEKKDWIKIEWLSGKIKELRNAGIKQIEKYIAQ